MKKHIRQLMVGLVSVAFLAVAIISPVKAANTPNQSANGFRISPIRSELTIEKGKRTTLTISVENPTNASTTVRADVLDFIAGTDESGQPKLILDDKTPAPKNDFKKLVGSVPDLELKPNERKTVNVTIAVPADASSGGYYGAVRFVPSSASDQSTVGVVASVGSLVLVTVPGNLNEQLSLVQLSAGQNDKTKSFLSKGKVDIITRLKNTGDIHVKPFGHVDVKNMFGKTVASFELNNSEPRSNVLPDTTRKFTNNLLNKSWLGRYTIEANIGYQQGTGNILSTKSSFWYIPTWALIILGVLVAGIGLGIYLLFRKYGKKGHRARK